MAKVCGHGHVAMAKRRRPCRRGRWRGGGSRGAVSCAELLLQAAAAERGRDTALARAATLQEQGARTACHEAARAGAEELVRALCARGADVDARDAHSRTPLIEAVRKKHAAVISALLVDFGAAVSIKDERGDNALHFAAASGQMRVLRTSLLASKRSWTDKKNSFWYSDK